MYFDIFHGDASVIVLCVKFDDFLESGEFPVPKRELLEILYLELRCLVFE